MRSQKPPELKSSEDVENQHQGHKAKKKTCGHRAYDSQVQQRGKTGGPVTCANLAGITGLLNLTGGGCGPIRCAVLKPRRDLPLSRNQQSHSECGSQRSCQPRSDDWIKRTTARHLISGNGEEVVNQKHEQRNQDPETATAAAETQGQS